MFVCWFKVWSIEWNTDLNSCAFHPRRLTSYSARAPSWIGSFDFGFRQRDPNFYATRLAVLDLHAAGLEMLRQTRLNAILTRNTATYL